MNKYKVEINVKHIVYAFAENETEAKEKAEMEIFNQRMDDKNGDLLTGYKVIPLRADAMGKFL